MTSPHPRASPASATAIAAPGASDPEHDRIHDEEADVVRPARPRRERADPARREPFPRRERREDGEERPEPQELLELEGVGGGHGAQASAAARLGWLK